MSADRLRQVEVAEQSLRELGIAGDLRVRYHDELARVELSQDSLVTWISPARYDEIKAAILGAGFERVAIDIRGFRSGSLNVLHGVAAP